MNAENLNTDELFNFELTESRRVRMGKAFLLFAGSLALCLSSCLPDSDEPALPVSEAVAESSEAAIRLTPITIESTTTTNPIDTTSTTIAPETTTTIEEPTTTTTAPAPEPMPWEPHIYQDNGCDEGDTLKVFVQGQDGKAVTAQVSADYMIGSQKVGVDGQPIKPLEGYSTYYVINPNHPPEGSMDGTKEVCFENIPSGASVYIEVYKLDRTENPNPHRVMVSTEAWYGHAMSHKVWPGPGQAVHMNLPKVCHPELGVTANSGAIHVSPNVNDTTLLSHRVVAWANGPARLGHSYGFAAEDKQFNDTDKEDTLRGLISGQTYLVQVQATDQQGMEYATKIEEVPVNSCQTTELGVKINPVDNSCIAGVGDKLLKCDVLDKLVG